MSAIAIKTDKPQQIQVFVRARPISQLERDARSTTSVEILGPRDIGIKLHHGKRYNFDRVFGPLAKQVDVYLSVVQPLIPEVLAGYNCTVFAYGQTGAGKTYTMAGGSALTQSVSWYDDEAAGIIPRALAHLFDELRVLQQETTVRVSYLELYNEELYDLLAENDDSSRIRIFEDQHQKGSVIIQGIEEQTVLNKNEVYKILEKGQEKRRTAATLMNAQSSRSHTVFTITVHARETTVEGELVVKTGKLHLVDLAGSENIGKSGAVDKRAREAGSINQSLLTLGRVIKALVERQQHIPYRESKLTRILQDSLGGRTKTSIIANISLASANLEETLSTLDYANRARNITNRPEVNLRMSQKGLIMQYSEEINRLRKDLAAARTGNGVYLAQENYDRLIVDNEIHKEELAEKIVYIRELQDKLNNLEEQKAFVEAKWHALEVSFEESKKNLQHVTTALEKTVSEKEEEQHLAVCYEERAHKLHEEANELLKVTKCSLSNEDQLLKKIERIREMANQNVNSVRGIAKKVTSLEQVLADNLIDYMKYSSQTNKTLMETAALSLECFREAQQQTAVFRNELLEHVNTSSTAIFNEITEKQRNNLETWINSVYSSSVTAREKQKVIYCNSIEVSFKMLLDLVNEGYKRFEDFCSSHNEQIKNISTLLHACHKSAETSIQEIDSIMLSHFSRLDGYLIEQHNDADRHLKRVQNNQKDIQQISRLLSELQNKIQILETDTKLNEKDILEYSTRNQLCKDVLTSSRNTLETKLPPVLDTMNESIKGIVKAQEDLIDKINLEKDQVTSDTKKQELIKKMQVDTNTILEETQLLVTTVDNLNNDISNKQTQNHNDSKHDLKLYLSKVQAMTNEQTSKDAATFNKFIESFNVTEKELINLDDSTNRNKELVECTFKTTQKELSLLTDELVEMKKSGDTPVRMQLPSSIRLSQPSPRQRILMRYKKENKVLEDENGDDINLSSNKLVTINELSPLRDFSDGLNISTPNSLIIKKYKEVAYLQKENQDVINS